MSTDQGDLSEYTITIDFDGFLTRFDLDEVIRSIDGLIESEILDYYEPEFRFIPRFYRYRWPYRQLTEPELSYIGITSVQTGSISLGIVVGGVVAMYVAKRFKKGVDASLFAEELERSGRLSGDFVGHILSRVNNWAEQYIPKQRELGGRVKKISVQRRRKANEDKVEP